MDDTPLSPPLPLSIEVFSDVVCPWCYLGKRRLEAALSRAPEIDVAVHWRPFRLDPSIPPAGLSRAAYLERKFGSLEAVAQTHASLSAYGADEDIDFRFDRITRAPNTTDAHRVIRWASDRGNGDLAVETLFRAYFTDGEDVGDPAVLAAIAGQAGMNPAETANRLAGESDRAEVQAEIDHAYRIGVSGVPCFILGKRYALVGAQPADTLENAIRAVVAELSTTGHSA